MLRNTTLTLAIVALSFSFPGCSNGTSEPPETSYLPREKDRTPVAPPAAGDTQEANSAAVGAADLTIQSPVAGKLNPAHGEPGHRCDLPIGAPLDGTASTGPATAPVLSVPSTAIDPPANAVGRINPAHGEPGHDCGVPVGSPLPG